MRLAKTPERKVWSENYSEWFHKVISEVPIYDTRSPVKGTGIWTPFGFKLRRAVTRIIRSELEKTGGDAVTLVAFDEEEFMDRIEQHIGTKLERRRYKDFDHGIGRFGATKPDLSRLRRGGSRRSKRKYV